MDVSIYPEGSLCAARLQSCLPTSDRSRWHLAYPSFVKEFTRRCLLRYVDNAKHLNHSMQWFRSVLRWCIRHHAPDIFKSTTIQHAWVYLKQRA